MSKNNWIIVTRFHDDTEGLGFYTRVLSDVYEEIRDPRQATIFPTKKEATDWIKDNSSMAEYMKAEKLEPHVELFMEHLDGGMVRRSFPLLSKSPINFKYNKTKHDWKDVVDWSYNYRNSRDPDSLVSYEIYSSWPHLWRVTKHLWEFNGYWTLDYSELVVGVELVFPKNDSDFQNFKIELDYVLDNYDLTHKDDDGNIIFTVFDRFLSEGGNSVTLVKLPDDKWRVESRYSSKTGDVSLKEAFDYLVRERYYGDDDE